MKAILRITICLALAALLFASAAWAQQPPPTPPPEKKPPQQGTPPQGQQPPSQFGLPGAAPAPTTPPVNKEEEDAYKAFFDLPKDPPDAIIEQGEAFLQKFPESVYRETVYSKMATAFLSKDQVDKLYVVAKKAIELNADNVDVLTLVSWAVPRRLNTGDLDAQQKLDECEKYGKHAIEVLETMVKPESITDEDFAKAKNEKLSMSHSGLGMVYYHRQRFADMATELEQAIKLSVTPDPTDYFLLGLAYEQIKRYEDATTAYGKCAESQWAWQARCKQSQDRTKKLAAAQPVVPKP